MKLKTSTILFILLVFSITVAVSGCTSSPGAVTPTPAYTSTDTSGGSNYSITITGGNTSPVTVTYADLKAMGMVEIKNVNQMSMNGKSVEHTSDYAGVPMMNILAKAGIPDGDMTFTMTSPDNYTMDYSRAELVNAMLGLERNGTTLNTDIEGGNAIVLVEPDQMGPMWIRVPVKIDIRKS